MKRKWLCLPVALVGGGVGFGLRRWQLATGFEAGTGLSIPGAPAAAALVAWSCVIAAVVGLLLWRSPSMPRETEKAFHAKGEAPFLTAAVLSGFLLMASGGAEAMTLYSAGWRLADLRLGADLLTPARVLLSLLGGVCVILWTRGLSREDGGTRESLAILELCLLFCVWLISDFRTRAIDPVTMNYVFEVGAIVCSLMGLYYIAGYSFQMSKPRRTALFCTMGPYFAMVTLADGHSPADLCRYGSIILFLTAHAALLLTAPQEEPAPAEVETEEKEHE